MANLTFNAATTADAGGALEYPDDMWAGSDAEYALPYTTFPHAFDVSGNAPFRDLRHAADREVE